MILMTVSFKNGGIVCQSIFSIFYIAHSLVNNCTKISKHFSKYFSIYNSCISLCLLEAPSRGIFKTTHPRWLNKIIWCSRKNIFPEDSTLCYKRCNISDLFSNVNDKLIKINYWFKANKFTLNVEKAKYLLFHKSTGSNDLLLTYLL